MVMPTKMSFGMHMVGLFELANHAQLEGPRASSIVFTR